MTQTGLVSVTFRKQSVQSVISLCKQADVQSIEWGGDVHVPHGDVRQAQAVGAATREGELEVASYGSYYRTIESENDGLHFDAVLKSAKALGAPVIRVWPGAQASDKATPGYRAAVVNNLRHIANMAADEGIGISLEFHAKTLTDTTQSAVQLLETVNHPNLKTLWQPSKAFTFEEQLASLQAVSPWIDYFHVYTWDLDGEGNTIRRALSSGEARWKAFFRQFKPRMALIEFVKDDSTEQFFDDIQVLKSWLH